jgi:Zn-dependent M28 family amino/carboxypeptidase
MGRDNFELGGPGGSKGYPDVAGWIPVDQARRVFAAAGRDFEQAKRSALDKGFRPVALGTASFAVGNEWTEITSRNVVARIEGSDPALRDEAVVYTAHWDHLGWDRTLPGPKARQVFHGALDNAGGIAALLEVARAFKAAPRAPRRSILFIATTSEERSLLGAQHYVRNPIVPLARTVACINIDGINPWGRTADVTTVGHGHTTLDELIAELAAGQQRVVVPDPRPEAGGFFRGDQLAFVREGVPSAWLGGGRRYIGRPASFAEQKRNRYVAEIYHRVGDVVDPEWDLSGAVNDVRLNFLLGWRVAEGAQRPEWKPDSEFRGKRQPAPQ